VIDSRFLAVGLLARREGQGAPHAATEARHF
jgi:hypothetical protein